MAVAYVSFVSLTWECDIQHWNWDFYFILRGEINISHPILKLQMINLDLKWNYKSWISWPGFNLKL